MTKIRLIRSSPVQAAIIACGVFVLPLLGSPSLDAPGPWLGACAAWLMLTTQPAVNSVDIRRAGPDRGSALAIFAAMIGAQLAAVLEFRFSGGLLRLNPALAVGLGAAAVVVGFSVRLWAIATLNQYFTSTVEVKSGQEVVRTGPYAWVRHPSYTGALVIAAGMLLMLRSGTGLLLLVVAVTPAYAYRINVEERALVGELGEEYVRYRNDVPALLPKLARHRVPLR